MTHFRALDTDGSGRLEAADLQLAKSKTPEEIERIRTQFRMVQRGGGGGGGATATATRKCSPSVGGVVV